MFYSICETETKKSHGRYINSSSAFEGF